MRRSSLLPLLFASALSLSAASAPDIKFSGDVQYKLRYHYTKLSDVDGDDSTSSGDFSNRIGWSFKVGVTVAEQLAFGLRFSNPTGSSADNIPDNTIWVSDTHFNKVAIPEASLKLSRERFYLAAGFLPIPYAGRQGPALLDLVAYETKAWVDVGTAPWSTNTNNSLAGLNAGYQFVDNDDFSAGIDVLAGPATDMKAGKPADALKLDRLQFFVSVPVDLMKGKLSILPSMHTRTNVYRSTDLDKANHSISGALDLKLAIIDAAVFTLGSAVGGYSNSCQEDEAAAQTAPLGFLLNAGTAVKPGFGSVKLDFSYGFSTDRQADPAVMRNTLFWDLTYTMPVFKASIAPRVRLWYGTNSGNERSKLQARPELTLRAGF